MICSQFLFVHAVRRSLTFSNELSAYEALWTASSMDCFGRSAACRVRTWSCLLGRCCSRAALLRENASVCTHVRAVLAATDALCIGCMCPVDGPVKMSAKYGLFMSHPLTSTQPKRKTYHCGRALGTCGSVTSAKTFVRLFSITTGSHEETRISAHSLGHGECADIRIFSQLPLVLEKGCTKVAPQWHVPE